MSVESNEEANAVKLFKATLLEDERELAEIRRLLTEQFHSQDPLTLDEIEVLAVRVLRLRRMMGAG